jgi:hypothetical protein
MGVQARHNYTDPFQFSLVKVNLELLNETALNCSQNRKCKTNYFYSLEGSVAIRILCMFYSIPDPDLLVRGTDPAPDPSLSS